MADAQDIADLEDLVARFGQPVVHQNSGMLQNLVDLSLGKEDESSEGGEDLSAPHRKPIKVERDKAGIDVVNVEKGGTPVGSYADLSPRPAGGGRPVVQGKARPVIVGGSLKFGLHEIEIAEGGSDSIDKLESTLAAHGSAYGAWMARALHNPQVDEPAADVAIGATTMTVQVSAGYLEGMEYEVRLDATGALIGTFEVDNVALAFDLTAVITFSSALSFGITVATMSIYLRGQGDSTLAIGSLSDLTDSTLAMYGLTTSEFPAGLERDVSGAWSKEDGKRIMSIQARQGNRPDCIVTSPVGRDFIVNESTELVRFNEGQNNANHDPYADAQEAFFNGRPIVACEQADDTTIVFGQFNKVKLREHRPYAPKKKTGGGRGPMGGESLIASETEFAHKILFDGSYRLICPKRRAFARFINVTS